MSEIKNIIITISGEPKSGKSSVVKILKEKYEEKGFKVHFINIGQLFRDYATQEYAKMYPNKEDANLADIQADESFAEKRKEIDRLLDKEIVEKKGKEINSKERPNEIFIVDARLGWENIPDSFAVRVTVDERIAGERAFNDKKRGSEDEYQTLEDAIEKTKQRKLVEIKRYKEQYGADLTNSENYNLIVDTSYSNIDELAEIIIDCEKGYRTKEYFPKYWQNSALFLPSQKIQETITRSPFGFTMEEVAESIKSIGYYPGCPVLAKVSGGITVLQDGHHRCIAAVLAGKTLVPYEIKEGTYTFEDVCKEIKLADIYDWEDMIRHYAKESGKNEEMQNFKWEQLSFMDKVIRELASEGR